MLMALYSPPLKILIVLSMPSSVKSATIFLDNNGIMTQDRDALYFLHSTCVSFKKRISIFFYQCFTITSLFLSKWAFINVLFFKYKKLELLYMICLYIVNEPLSDFGSSSLKKIRCLVDQKLTKDNYFWLTLSLI